MRLGGGAGFSAMPRIASCLASSCLSPLLSNVLLNVLGQDVQPSECPPLLLDTHGWGVLDSPG